MDLDSRLNRDRYRRGRRGRMDGERSRWTSSHALSHSSDARPASIDWDLGGAKHGSWEDHNRPEAPLEDQYGRRYDRPADQNDDYGATEPRERTRQRPASATKPDDDPQKG